MGDHAARLMRALSELPLLAELNLLEDEANGEIQVRSAASAFAVTCIWILSRNTVTVPVLAYRCCVRSSEYILQSE